MTPTPEHFSEIIHTEFKRRIAKNESYSLRAFARDLDISVGSLSLILNKKTGITLKKAERLLANLKLEKEEEKFFLCLVETVSRKKANQEKAKNNLFQNDTKYHTLDTQLFEVIANWYHFALMELVLTADFRYDMTWMSNRLNISIDEIEAAVARLLKLEILEVKNNTLVPTRDFVVVPSHTPSEAVKTFQTQILKKLIDSFQTQSRDERDISSVVVRMRKEDLGIVRDSLKEVRRKLSSRLIEGDGHESVYCITTAAFRLDHSL